MTRSATETQALQKRIRQLAQEKDAVILAHNYQSSEVQDVADFTGDSLALSRLTLSDAAATAACGVDYISVGALTHSAPILDLALDM